MRFDRFDLNLLVALDALLEEKNVTRASKRLHIGQSAMSGSLSRLREHFGDELLVPMGRNMVLTAFAQNLVEPVHQTLLHARTTISRKLEFDPLTVKRRILVTASDYVSTVLLAKVVQKLAILAPGLILDIRSPMQDVFERFDRGNIDLLIMPEQYLTKIDCPRIHLFKDTHACIVWSGNHLVKDSFTIEQYMTLGHVTVHLSDERNTLYEEWFIPRYGKHRKVELSVDNFGLVPLVIIGTQRVGTLHRKQAEHFGRYLPLRLMDTPFVMPPVSEAMVSPAHLNDDPAMLWLHDLLLQSAVEEHMLNT
jgi:LysR family transcriptional regulator, nod-box dependent transcriptional activator